MPFKAKKNLKNHQEKRFVDLPVHYTHYIYKQVVRLHAAVISSSCYKLVVVNLVYSNLLHAAMSDLLGQLVTGTMKLSTFVTRFYRPTTPILIFYSKTAISKLVAAFDNLPGR